MSRVLHHAFFLRVPIPGLGDLPLNLVGCATALGLGCIHPGFWLLGLGLETLYLLTLTTNARFRRVVEALDRERDRGAVADTLLAGLPADLRAVHQRLATIAGKAAAIQSDTVAGRDTLDDLVVIALRLLTAKHHLRTVVAETDETALKAKAAALRQEQDANPAVRQSQLANLDLITRRLTTLQRNQEFLRRIDADLDRIESQLTLALEEASGGAGSQIDLTIGLDLAGRLLDAGVYGESAAAVASLAPAGAVAPPAQPATVPQ
jgi:hypothetical protein